MDARALTLTPTISRAAGMTSFGGTYYHGPTQEGATLHFKLYALSVRLDALPRGVLELY